MSNENVIIYISENNPQCGKVLKLMDTLGVNYKTKNVTKSGQYLHELQNQGIYGTPATFIADRKYPILGFQKDKLKTALGKENNRSALNCLHLNYKSYGN